MRYLGTTAPKGRWGDANGVVLWGELPTSARAPRALARRPPVLGVDPTADEHRSGPPVLPGQRANCV